MGNMFLSESPGHPSMTSHCLSVVLGESHGYYGSVLGESHGYDGSVLTRVCMMRWSYLLLEYILQEVK